MAPDGTPSLTTGRRPPRSPYAKAVGLPERPGRGLLEATGEGAEPYLPLFPESGRHGVPPVITRATPSGSRRTVDA